MTQDSTVVESALRDGDVVMVEISDENLERTWTLGPVFTLKEADVQRISRLFGISYQPGRYAGSYWLGHPHVKVASVIRSVAQDME